MDDLARPHSRPKALRYDLPLFLDRPEPPTLATRDHLDPLRASGHMTTLMTAPYRSVLLDRRRVALHYKPSAHSPRATQGGFSTPLTYSRYFGCLVRTSVLTL